MTTKAIFLQLLDDPLVYCIGSGWNEQVSLALCLRQAAGRPFHLLVNTTWEVATILHDLAALHVRATRHPGVKVTFLCQTSAETMLLRDVGLDALHVHRGTLVDDAVFRPDVPVSKCFSAVHTANYAPFKRHALAWSVRRIALIAYHALPDRDAAGVRGYEDIAWRNFDDAGGTRELAGAEVAAIIRQAHCGLILSELEGGNIATAEYLFCGVPVVSTLSRGGRHALYDMASVTIVAPERRAVAAAVEAAERRPIDAAAIHARMMERARPHRRRLIDWLSRVGGRDLFPEAGDRLWLPRFRHRLRNLVDAETARELGPSFTTPPVRETAA